MAFLALHQVGLGSWAVPSTRPAAVPSTRPAAAARASAADFDEIEACNTVVGASSISELSKVLQGQLAGSTPPRYVFFDVDECLVMPEAPFIDGLPGSDALVRKLTLCGEAVMSTLRARMVEAYYSAPIRMVDDDLPDLISHLRFRGVFVYGLTSRGRTLDINWHNHRVVDALLSHRVRFSELPAEHMGRDGVNTKAGGILYAGGEHVNKAILMNRLTGGVAPATLIDNSAGKLFKATSFGRSCVHGVHFTAAWAREASDSERRRWIRELSVGDDEVFGI